MEKLVIINANLHRVYWGWYKYLTRKFEVYLIVPQDVPYLPVEDVGIDKKNVYFAKVNRITNYYYFLEIKEIIKRIKPDVVFPKIIFLPHSIESFKLSKELSYKFVLFDELRNFPDNSLVKLLFNFHIYRLRRFYKKIPTIGVTKQSFEFLSNLGFTNTFYLPYSFWKNDYKKIEHPQDKLRLLYVGRLTYIKNVEFLIRTLKYMLKNKIIKENEIELTIIGDGELRNNLIELTKKLNLQKVIKFLGKIDNEKLDDYYKSHNLFILPSIKESVGLVVLEAMYNSLPSLVSKNAGASSYVADYYNGITFNPRNLKSLSLAIEFYKDEDLRVKHGKNSLKLLKESFDYKKIGKELYKILKS